MTGRTMEPTSTASPILYAHRGASKERPENTLEAFRLALELGAGAIETDAHMTRDGHVVLSHDATGERVAGVPIAIRDATLEEIRRWSVGGLRVPTLDEALAACPGVLFNVDAKQVAPNMIPALLRCVRAANAERRVRIASFSTTNLRRARALGYAGPIGLSAAEIAALVLLPLPIAKATRIADRGDAAQVPPRAYGVTFASQRTIDRLHVLGLRVDFWTIDDPDEARRLVAMGADGIVTDDVRAIAPALQRSSWKSGSRLRT
ncbi:MAG: glycerophosphodiester phosphodiesterase [Labilithrix sp.]|nr:glycerophosphodiester phosphodiesterase [Labilithrix sp.]